jgi:hypothetical protein
VVVDSSCLPDDSSLVCISCRIVTNIEAVCNIHIKIFNITKTVFGVIAIGEYAVHYIL